MMRFCVCALIANTNDAPVCGMDVSLVRCVLCYYRIDSGLPIKVSTLKLSYAPSCRIVSPSMLIKVIGEDRHQSLNLFIDAARCSVKDQN